LLFRAVTIPRVRGEVRGQHLVAIGQHPLDPPTGQRPGEGMARVDFLLETSTGKLYINEINTIPGFTSISMYPKMWEHSGIAFSALIDKLIALALDRHKRKMATKFVRC